MKNLCWILSFIFSFAILIPQNVQASTLSQADTITTYVNETLGIQIVIPPGWEYDTSGKVIEKARDTARDIASQALGVSKEVVTEIDESGSDKGILIRMHLQGAPLPAVQIITRDLSAVPNAPETALQHLSGFISFISSMTYIDIIDPVEEVDVNGTLGAHVAYETESVLEGEDFRTRSDVYSFIKQDRTIDMTFIQDLDSTFPQAQEQDIQILTQSILVSP